MGISATRTWTLPLPSSRVEFMVRARPNWTSPFQDPDSGALPVRIWRLRLGNLGEAAIETLRRMAAPSERIRAQKYRFDADRQRHLAGRALVRAFVARTRGGSPQAVSIREGPRGKPRLAADQESETDLEFNIAHTANVVVAAFSRTHSVGIDVETLDRTRNLDGLAERVLTGAEWDRWHSLAANAQPAFFFRVWTCKEAFLKATGQGLQRAPRTVECAFDGGTVVGLRDVADYQPSSAPDAAERWAVRPFSVTDRVLGAVVRAEALPFSISFADASGLVPRWTHA